MIRLCMLIGVDTIVCKVIVDLNSCGRRSFVSNAAIDPGTLLYIINRRDLSIRISIRDRAFHHMRIVGNTAENGFSVCKFNKLLDIGIIVNGIQCLIQLHAITSRNRIGYYN